jgi:hypothetical protein
MAVSPTSITIRTYQVGFGDCHLLRFDYAQGARHILIDFGSTGLPENADKVQMKLIAEDIAQRCGGKLEAVIATHRHADHVSGFATNAKGDAPGNVIRNLKPQVVIQPWTEDPNLATDSLGPADSADNVHIHAFAKNLQRMHDISREVVRLTQPGAANALPKALAEQLNFLGEDNLKNKSAVDNLMTMSKQQVYVHYGSDAGLSQILPGVKVRVLGPPTLRQSGAIRKMAASNPSEFWQLHLRRLSDTTHLAKTGGNLFPDFPSSPGNKLRFSARWLANRMKSIPGEQTLQLVRILDEQMNNTSVILLFEVGKKKLLFPGDAQIENWAYALSKPETAALLADVDLYKVGHHGSRNATPRSMWKLFDKRGPKTKKSRMRSVLSTMPGKHGTEKSKTEVPRATLLTALDKETELHNTNDLADDQLFEEVVL